MATLGKVQIGKTAPDFNGVAVVDGKFKDISLSSYTDASHWLILIFFPKAWSFICPTEIKAFDSRLEEFLYKRTCAVVFCSTDNEHCLKAWNNASDMEGGLGGVHVPLISDSSHTISKDFGVLLEDEGIAHRALFIIDPKGRVRNITVNDADVGRSVDETQRVLDALIFKDEFGEGCPIDWKKGDKGIDIKTKTSVDGPIEISKRTTWSEWARPKLQRAWSGASTHSVSSTMGVSTNLSVPLRSNGTERPLSHLGYDSTNGSGSRSPLVSPMMRSPNVNHFERQMEEAMNLNKNTEIAVENMRAAMQNQTIGMTN